jgi:hypothetical protein
MVRWFAVLGLCAGKWVFGQGAADRTVPSDPIPVPAAAAPSGTQPAKPAESAVSRNWRHFVGETFGPLTVAAGAFYGAMSQATNSDPRYGVGAGALGQRIGASTADITTQNFFGDFLMATAFRENVVYVRRGSDYGGIWKRTGYAVSRAFITRSDRGGETFNWSNLTGTAMSTGFSNLYYPPASRTGGAMAIHFGTGLVGAGFGNLFPEFWPDFHAMLRRHHLIPKP